ncbi:hypothetical protein N7532_004309 [Penicillium argentinense]|uniref:Uncharacterized protein n=1 Tax=Penicillium argentinense TaxID=1131581 RepID=A0A9W9FP54_9EURO|nr:uncharacterized protein N7532_004309 [Penicillium argentinense]KAJ5103780.1 hypothetical protein N7532_004309 [Penicillium argentinense]
MAGSRLGWREIVKQVDVWAGRLWALVFCILGWKLGQPEAANSARSARQYTYSILTPGGLYNTY